MLRHKDPGEHLDPQPGLGMCHPFQQQGRDLVVKQEQQQPPAEQRHKPDHAGNLSAPYPLADRITGRHVQNVPEPPCDGDAQRPGHRSRRADFGGTIGRRSMIEDRFDVTRRRTAFSPWSTSCGSLEY